jgi:hypothetical protein
MNRILLFSIIFSTFSICSYCQSVEETYLQLIKISNKNDFTHIFRSADSISKLDVEDYKFFRLYLDRKIDLNFHHKRILFYFKSNSVQLDFLIRNDSILFEAIKSGNKNLLNYTYDTSQISIFIEQRNKLYGAKKSFNDLKKEIIISESFAMYCGDALPLTDKGKKIIGMVNDEEIEEFRNMTQSFSPEIQAYGVVGLEMLKRNDFELSDHDNWVIKYIRKRNAEVISCSGCFDGIVSKIYSIN